MHIVGERQLPFFYGMRVYVSVPATTRTFSLYDGLPVLAEFFPPFLKIPNIDRFYCISWLKIIARVDDSIVVNGDPGREAILIRAIP
jgi:uncharacterized membrane protein (DUF485 family)